jgi:hypothetical protein
VLYTDAGREKLPLREITVGEAAIDLGDVVDDRGRVVLKIDADDRNDMASIEQVLLTLDPEVAGWAPDILTFTRDGDRWLCDGVPAGWSVAQIYLGNPEAGGISYGLKISRTAGQGDLQLAVRLRKRSATLRAPASTQPTRNYVEGTETDGVVVSAYVMGDQPAGVKLPPGTYRLASHFSPQWLRERPTTILRADESAELNVPPRDQNRRRQVRVFLWSSDGALLTTPKVTIVDTAGQVVTPDVQFGQESVTFLAEPAAYTVRVERPNHAAFEQTIDLSAPPEPSSFQEQRDIVLPD